MRDEEPIKVAIATKLAADVLPGVAYARGIANIVGDDQFGNVRVYLDLPDVTSEQLLNLEEWQALSYDIIDFVPAHRGNPNDVLVQIDAWSKDKDIVDEIVARVNTLLHDNPLTVAGQRVDSIVEQRRIPLYDEQLKVHRKMVQYRLLTWNVA